VLPVVEALKKQPNCRQLVPAELWKYFDEPVLISGWYPERDYWVLISALVKTIDAAAVGGDVWRFFAKFSAQRDIGGRDVKSPADVKLGGSGVYRTFSAVDSGDPERFLRRVTQLWSQYHDSGRLEVIGALPSENAVVLRLSGFLIPIEGFVLLQGYYVEEYGRLVGIEVSSVVTRSTTNKDRYCEWKLKLGRTRVTEAYVASLEVLEIQ
jgi:hypothetical protein